MHKQKYFSRINTFFLLSFVLVFQLFSSFLNSEINSVCREDPVFHACVIIRRISCCQEIIVPSNCVFLKGGTTCSRVFCRAEIFHYHVDVVIAKVDGSAYFGDATHFLDELKHLLNCGRKAF